MLDPARIGPGGERSYAGPKTSGRFLKRTLLPEVIGARPDHDCTFQAKPVSAVL